MKLNPFGLSTRVMVGVGVQLMCAMHINQTHGLTEMHFQIFVLLAFLSIYRDWRVILASTVTVAVHHVLFFYIQSSGGNVFIFAEGYVTFGILVLHAAFALAEGLLLMYTSADAHKEAVSAHSLRLSIEKMLEDSQSINLNNRADGKTSEIGLFNKLITSFSELIQSAKGEITNSLIAEAHNSVNKMSMCMDKVTKSVSMTEQVEEKTDLVTSNMARLNSHIDSVAKSTSEQTEVSRSIAQSSHELMTATSDQSKELAKTLSEVKQLQILIDSLNNQMMKFV